MSICRGAPPDDRGPAHPLDRQEPPRHDILGQRRQIAPGHPVGRDGDGDDRLLGRVEAQHGGILGPFGEARAHRGQTVAHILGRIRRAHIEVEDHHHDALPLLRRGADLVDPRDGADRLLDGADHILLDGFGARPRIGHDRRDDGKVHIRELLDG